MKVHLVDGTYELFRHFYGMPEAARSESELGGVRGVVESLVWMLEQGATHMGVATDHVIESFRNDMWPGYKSSAGMDPAIVAQFEPLEGAIRALGVTVWAMEDWEADDALASAAHIAAQDDAVDQVLICTPDKDLAQCVRGTRVVELDRRRSLVIDEDAVVEKFGVRPESIPDWLALVGDSADGFPGLPGWGAKTAAAVLARYGHIVDIPASESAWDVDVRGAAKLSATLEQGREAAALFLDLATLRIDPDLIPAVEDLRWTGPEPGFDKVAEALGSPGLAGRVGALNRRRG